MLIKRLYIIDIKRLELNNGSCPFDNWYEELKSDLYRKIIDAYLSRLQSGNFGNTRSLKGGVFELKINTGPGLRIYYGVVSQKYILLLCAGDKSTQARDIELARSLWWRFKDETKRL